MKKIEILGLIVALIVLQFFVFTDFSLKNISSQHILASLIFSVFFLITGLVTRLVFLRIERGELSDGVKILSMFGAIVSITPLIFIYVVIIKNESQLQDFAPGPFWLLLYPLSLFLTRFLRYLDFITK
jgi:hypothetical protein